MFKCSNTFQKITKIIPHIKTKFLQNVMNKRYSKSKKNTLTKISRVLKSQKNSKSQLKIILVKSKTQSHN